MISVLIVEDDWAAREGLRDRFTDELDFIEVETAQTPQEALEKLVRLKPDVVVLDCKLQNQFSGPQIAAEIRARGWPTRILAHSAYASPELVRAMLDAGAIGYYVKGDSTQAEMVTAVRMVAVGQGWFSASIQDEVLKWFQTRDDDDDDDDDEMTPRQVEILRLVEQGLTNKAIALALNRSEKNIEGLLGRIYRKLGASNRAQAVAIAKDRGVI